MSDLDYNDERDKRRKRFARKRKEKQNLGKNKQNRNRDDYSNPRPRKRDWEDYINQEGDASIINLQGDNEELIMIEIENIECDDEKNEAP